MIKNPTPQQGAIFNWFATGKGNLVVQARAGSSKTTSIVEGITFARDPKILVAAFNKHIATELQHKLDHPGAIAKTLHSHGFGFVRDKWQGVKVDMEGAEELFVKIVSKVYGEVPGPVRRTLVRAFSQVREVDPFVTDKDSVLSVMDAFDIWPDENYEANGFPGETIAEMVCLLLVKARDKRSVVDFSDMVWLPLVNGWVKPQYNLVVIDEAQDMNAGQIELAIRSSKGRICVVGDDRQCIYAFRGADQNTINSLEQRLQATTLPLTVSFRCPKLVVQEAQKIVPDFQEWEGAKDGEILSILWKNLKDNVKPKDFILSRTNAVLSKAAFGLLKQGVSVQILGKDIGARLVKIIQARKAKNIVDLMEKIRTWSGDEQAKAIAAGRKGKAAAVIDQADTIIALAEECSTINELVASIQKLFDDNKHDPVICSTVHKAKGLEADNVFILMESFAWIKKITANNPEDALSEANIEYVALTRAKNKLYRVLGKPEI